MSLVSMTGYGRGEVVSKGLKVEVELSSVNRKQFDVRVNLPSNLIGMDAKLKNLIHDSISRGSITGVVRIGGTGKCGGANLKVNIDVAEACLQELRKAGRQLKIRDDIGLRDLIRLPDVVNSGDFMLRDAPVSWLVLKRALDEAVNSLKKMRQNEGRELEKDIKARLSGLSEMVSAIRRQIPAAETRFKNRLMKKLKEAGLRIKNSDDKFQREIIFYIDKADISEEVVRLESHFKHAEKLIASNEPAGRALDFLCQEMFREINTIGSKSSDAKISRQVLLFKTELECIREQVQNIE